MAKLTFIYGAMNSGKSDSLIKIAYNYTEQGLRVVTIKPAADTKHATDITARAGGRWRVDVRAKATTNIEAAVLALADPQSPNCILVDESQFLTKQQIDQLYRLAKLHDISVVAFGLRSDFQTHLFTGSRRLFEIADAIDKLVTMCRCGEQAEFNCRLVDGRPSFSGQQVAIDGKSATAYTSLCGTCYYKEQQQATKQKEV